MNINHEYLEQLWSSIILSDQTAYDYKRIDGTCIPELCLGLSSNSSRCLVLELPRTHDIDFQPFKRKNLTLKLYSEESIIVLELKNPAFDELFSDLVISLYQSIRDITSVENYSSLFITTFHKWSEFFSERDSENLSGEAVKGLIGELIVLRKILQGRPSSEMNLILGSWKGPYDKGKDFEMTDKDIEVKTKNEDRFSVMISSEHQLNPSPGKGLELWVVSVQQRHDEGLTLSDVIIEIQNLIINKLGGLFIFRKALWQKGLTIENSHDYDYLKFIPKSLSSYNGAIDGFPALKSSSLNSAITKVRYELNLSLIDNYRIDEISL